MAGVLARVFNGPKGTYVYDTGSGRVFAAGLLLAEVLQVLTDRDGRARTEGLVRLERDNGPANVAAALAKIEAARDGDPSCFLTSHAVEDLALADSSAHESQRGRLRKLTLELTQQCQFRCGYCPYSAGSTTTSPYYRKHASKHMPLKVAMGAIDFFACNRDQRSENRICFYGGEPLLKWDTAVECMEYARSRCGPVLFSLTTNGYLLAERMFPVLAKYDVDLAVSIDGPKTLHDGHRRLVTGKPTFDKIVANLEQLARVDGDYFSRKVTILPTLFEGTDLLSVVKFFRGHRLLRRARVRPTLVGADTRPAVRDFLERLSQRRSRDLSVEISFSANALGRVVLSRPLSRRQINMGGFCELGSYNLFVNVSGGFWACEDPGILPRFGNLEGGLDWGVIEKMEFERKAMRQACACHSCWAIALCPRCWVGLYDNPSKPRSTDALRKSCRRIRAAAERCLEQYGEAIDAGLAEALSTEFLRVQRRALRAGDLVH